MAEEISLIPQGIREGISTKSGKPYKFYSYFMVEANKFASSNTELKAGDVVSVVSSPDGKFTNLVSGQSFKVILNS